MTGERFQPKHPEDRAKADRLITRPPFLTGFETKEDVTHLLAGQDVNEVVGSIFRRLSSPPRNMTAGPYLHLSRLISEHLIVDAPTVFSYYLEGLGVLKKEAKGPYCSVGELYAPRFPKTLGARRELMTAWEEKGFQSPKELQNNHHLIKMQLSMLGEGDVPDSNHEPVLAWITTARTMLLEAKTFSGLFKEEKAVVHALIKSGASLDLTPGTMSIMLGVSLPTIKRLLDKPVAEVVYPSERPAPMSVTSPTEEERDWIRRARRTDPPKSPWTEAYRAELQALVAEGLALGIRSNTMSGHLGVSAGAINHVIAALQEKER